MEEFTWFAGNFCPVGNSCSLEGGLKPSTGPEIRTMTNEGNNDKPYLAEIRKFFEVPDLVDGVQWMKAEGQLLSLIEYVGVYPIVGYMYGSPASRAVFPLPNLNDQIENNYYICVKGGREPVR